MDRRVSGGLLLVLALVAALVVPQILNPPRLPGTATIAPPPPPPVAGECVQQAISGYGVSPDGELISNGPLTLVPCTGKHGGEILSVDDVLARPSPDAQSGEQPADALLNQCWMRVQELWETGDPPLDGWWPQASVDLGLVGPDRWQTAAGQQWAACTIGVVGGELTDRVEDLSPRGGVPAAFGNCSTVSHDQDNWSSLPGCTVPHNHEDFGFRQLDLPSELTQNDLERSCLDLVTRATGRVGIATDEGLFVETLVYSWDDSGEGGISTLPLPAGADGGYVYCAVHTTGDKELAASLRDIGDAALPWAP